MPAPADAQRFCEHVNKASTMAEVTSLLSEVGRELGFQWVTLAHHVDPGRLTESSIAFSTYPEGWVHLMMSRGYFVDDPVLLACERTAAPLLWSQASEVLPLTARQEGILRSAREHGLREGFSVPAHVPGEPLGSCSFATRKDGRIPTEVRIAAHWVGAHAFDAARRIVGLKRPVASRPRLTPRQFECVVLVGQGKSDGVIAQLLGLSPQTVHEHLESAKRRYGVASRPQLVTCCLADGQLSYADLLSR